MKCPEPKKYSVVNGPCREDLFDGLRRGFTIELVVKIASGEQKPLSEINVVGIEIYDANTSQWRVKLHDHWKTLGSSHLTGLIDTTTGKGWIEVEEDDSSLKTSHIS